MTETVFKVDNSPKTTVFSMAAFQKPRPGEPLSFEVNLVADSDGSQIKRSEVQPNTPGWESFSITCDEGTGVGGHNTAPSPLSYFTSGIAFCLLTHLAMFAALHKLKVSNLRIEQRMRFSTHHDHAKQKQGLWGSSDGIDAHILLDSDEPEDMIRRMFEECTNSCLALMSIQNATPVTTNLHLNGKQLNTLER